jgi:hypothetical protein
VWLHVAYGWIAGAGVERATSRADHRASGNLDSREVEESGRAMPVLDAQADGCPNADEVRAALGSMAASEAFRGSPQLISFLRYVVEATLRGEQDRIKGYTIAVEALGRGDDFDPQDDPIVRVEAMRLRRAIQKYYANGGKDEPLQIDLTVGSYVPVFRRAIAAPAPAPQPASASQSRIDWRRLATGAALMLIGAAIYAALDFLFDFNTPNPNAARGFGQAAILDH